MNRMIHRVLAVVLIVVAVVAGNWPDPAARSFAQEGDEAAPTAALESLPTDAPADATADSAADSAADSVAPGSASSASPALPTRTTNTTPGSPTAPGAPGATATLRNPALPTSIPSNARVAMIRIDGEIREFTLNNLRHRMEEAKKAGAEVIVIELDTPGGELNASLKISQFIKGFGLPTVAWVNPQAYSGGIMTAAACDMIVMSAASATGDCAPVNQAWNLAPAERAKLVSPILTEFRDSAMRSGVDYTLFHAMVELNVRVYRVRLPATGEERLVNQADYDIMVRGEDRQAVIDKYKQTQAQGTLTPQGPITVTPSGGPPVMPGIFPEETLPSNEIGRWNEVAVVHDGNTLLTMTQSEALAAGLSRGTVADEIELQQFLGAATVFHVSVSWAAMAADFLSQPWVRGLLIAIMLIAAYIEFQAPGVGLPGAIAITALVILLGAPYLIGLSKVWHLIIFGIGAIMLAVEIFTPTFGILGIGGIFIMLAGLVLMVVPSNTYGIPQNDMLDRLALSMTFTTLGIVAALVGFYFINKHFGSIPLLNRMILGNPEPVPHGPGLLNPNAGTITRTSGDDALGEGELAVGDTGKALTTLRPSGQARIGGYTVDVVSIGSMIDPGQRVKIIAIDGNRIQVDQDRSND